jgi:manganese oxidase
MKSTKPPSAFWWALLRRRWLPLGLGALAPVIAVGDAEAQAQCARMLHADVVALDQPIWYNRLGAFDPVGMIYALREDVVPISGFGGLTPGNVQLRTGKRPRPLVLRMNVGDCLTVNFTNLLDPTPQEVNVGLQSVDQPHTRHAGIRAAGVHLVRDINDDASHVGRNPNSLVPPGGTATYIWHAPQEGTFLIHSAAAMTGGEGDQGQSARGLFGALNVQPRGARWIRSQLTQAEMAMATTGTTPAGQPVIDYQRVYPVGHPLAGRPILQMLDAQNRIRHTDLAAVVLGDQADGTWAANSFPDGGPPAGNRSRPYREYTVIFHDEMGILQAFDVFNDPMFRFTLAGGRDAFAINYGSGGIGAEVLGNRLGVGPMANCVECKYEDFFLTSWVVGDAAMVVDIPANASDGQGNLIPGYKATRELYPDDPSNVFHSYLGDRVVLRNLHVGREHHIFHLHAHQWLHTPGSDLSTILDSQSIGPGGSYTYEIAYGGSGNRNMTPGDAIFHCHFYPHFAQGMWAMWRIHDVFEAGTVLDADGYPAAGARVLPDAELNGQPRPGQPRVAAGALIPAVVPIPGEALAPIPTEAFPGFPFYIEGRPGHRPPLPPLDLARGPDGQPIDGGLPRHRVKGGVSHAPPLNLYDFSKHAVELVAEELPVDGTQKELRAMAFHATHEHPTWRINPATGAVESARFLTNGLPGRPGAPFADPCRTDAGLPAGGIFGANSPRVYKTAAFQTSLIYSKKGWHFPQHRMFALFDDVVPTMNGTRTPEPLFFRANTGDCIELHFVNLVPYEYQMDDFQVRTPTDLIGQHIHLVKFDVTSSDGASNGFNYEDGLMSPDEVRERIHAINARGGIEGLDGNRRLLTARAHPHFGPTGPNGENWLGAQQGIQRWFADDVLSRTGEDRTLRNVFSHDHFGPSTHQQTGLYSSLVVEPAGSRWRHAETGVYFGSRHDGGPTSWQAIIETADPSKSFREFNLMFQDFALAYRAGADLSVKHLTDPRTGHVTAGRFDPNAAVNPPGKFEQPLTAFSNFLLRPPVAGQCPNGTPAPCPEMISVEEPGMFSVNYRTEPLALRVRDPNTNTQAPFQQGDLALSFSSNVNRADPDLNRQPTFYPPLVTDMRAQDPFTPLLRAFEGDRVQIRTLVGAHEEGHNFGMHGFRWFFEPSDTNSGYRASQMAGISEMFVFDIPAIPGLARGNAVDYLYMAGASTDDLWGGAWGLMRVYKTSAQNLLKLPRNPEGGISVKNSRDFNGVCPRTAPVRNFDVSAVLARDALPVDPVLNQRTLVYNARGGLHDPTAILYVRTADLDGAGRLRPDVPIEPLVLRANAGDCLNVTLRNRLPANVMPDADGYFTLPLMEDQFNNNQIRPSNQVGLHAQLVEYDPTRSHGANIGNNNNQLAPNNKTVSYQWYAGRLEIGPDGNQRGVPVEFGAINLQPADMIKQPQKGLFGALIVEPQGATWVEDSALPDCGQSGKPRCSRAAATITRANGTRFREAVLMFQSGVNLQYADGSPVENLDDADDPEDSGAKALNYRTEPMWLRMGFDPDEELSETNSLDFTNVLSNIQVGGDPETPIFHAAPGAEVYLRVLKPAGNQRNHVLTVHGHGWQELPYVAGSTRIGERFDAQNRPISNWRGAQDGIGPGTHHNFILKQAGGPFSVSGDFLIRDVTSHLFSGGLWAILRVANGAPGAAASGANP